MVICKKRRQRRGTVGVKKADMRDNINVGLHRWAMASRPGKVKLTRLQAILQGYGGSGCQRYQYDIDDQYGWRRGENSVQ